MSEANKEELAELEQEQESIYPRPFLVDLTPPLLHAPTYISSQSPAIIFAQDEDELCPNGGHHDFDFLFTRCGIVWGVVCFPCGMLCCCNSLVYRCKKCHTIEI